VAGVVIFSGGETTMVTGTDIPEFFAWDDDSVIEPL
jgi:hypothetical protein